MDTPPVPNPARPVAKGAKGLGSLLTGRKPIVYGAMFVTVIAIAWVIRSRQKASDAAQAVATGPVDDTANPYGGTTSADWNDYGTSYVPGPISGNYGGYSTPDGGGGATGFDWMDFFQGQQQQHDQQVQDLIGQIVAQNTGGGLPSAPIENVAPAYTPAPAAPAPVATVSTAQATTSKKTCSSEYPNYPHWNSGRGAVGPSSCYRTGCNSKGHKTRYYKGGSVDVLQPVVKC